MRRIITLIATLFGVIAIIALVLAHRVKEMPYIRLSQVAPEIGRSDVKLLGATGCFRPERYIFGMSTDIAKKQIRLASAVRLDDFYSNSDYVLENGVKPFISPYADIKWEQAEVYGFEATHIPMCDVYIVLTPEMAVMMIYLR